MNDYPYIRAWGRMLSSDHSYVWEEVNRARADKAPDNAVYKGDDGRWRTLADVTSTYMHDLILRIVAESK